VRLGFVSNSSSSSYLCEICGEIESGMDADPSDFNMVHCEDYHCFHDRCLSEEMRKETYRELEEDDDWDGYEIPKKHCPICNFKIIDSFDLQRYVVKTNHNIINEIKERFKNYEEFRKFLREKV